MLTHSFDNNKDNTSDNNNIYISRTFLTRFFILLTVEKHKQR